MSDRGSLPVSSRGLAHGYWSVNRSLGASHCTGFVKGLVGGFKSRVDFVSSPLCRGLLQEARVGNRGAPSFLSSSVNPLGLSH